MLHTHPSIYHPHSIMFFPSTSVSPVSIIPPMLHTHPSIYHPHSIMFFPSTSVSSVSIIPPMRHTHSFIYHRRCITFFSQYFSFPCQYHSTNAPYSFIQLPPMLYNIFLPVLQFSPVSIIPPVLHIHSSTTNAVYCFSPST